MTKIDYCEHCRAEIKESDKHHIHTSNDGTKVYFCDNCHNDKRYNIITKAQRIFNKIILGI